MPTFTTIHWLAKKERDELTAKIRRLEKALDELEKSLEVVIAQRDRLETSHDALVAVLRERGL